MPTPAADTLFCSDVIFHVKITENLRKLFLISCFLSLGILQIQKVEFVEVYQFLKNNSNGVAAQTEIAYWKNNNKKSFIFPKNTIDFGKDFSH